MTLSGMTPSSMTPPGVDPLKRAAALEALRLVEDGMTLGLGSGSTAEIFLDELAGRIASGFRIVGVPTSKRVGELAGARGIPLAELSDVTRIDLAVDGADEIETAALGLVKGRGGALLREKLVAATAARFCIIADDSKLVTRLGEKFAVPVAVVPFGWRQIAVRIRSLGGEPALRQAGAGPLVSDDGLYILDCTFGPIPDPARLAADLKGTLGVVEHGLFLGMAERAIVAGAGGVQVLEPRGVTT
jgi:ribose 5-phosphate isomerase A